MTALLLCSILINELRYTVHTQPPLFTPLHHNCCATYAHDFKWHTMQGASSGHASNAALGRLGVMRDASAVGAVGADET